MAIMTIITIMTIMAIMIIMMVMIPPILDPKQPSKSVKVVEKDDSVDDKAHGTWRSRTRHFAVQDSAQLDCSERLQTSSLSSYWYKF